MWQWRVCPVSWQGQGQGGAGDGFLPEESERDSEPDDAGFLLLLQLLLLLLLLLLVGMVSTAAGSTQSEASAASVPHGETHCALLGLTESLVTGETPAGAAAGALPPAAFSGCLLAEKLLHMQSWMMMELRLPKSFSLSGMKGLSHSSS